MEAGFNPLEGMGTFPLIVDTWTPSTWAAKPKVQDVKYDDQPALAGALHKLRQLPPLVTPQEITSLKRQLRDAAEGKAFVLQGGDCAELFQYCNQDQIEAKVKLLLQMSMVLIWGGNRPVIRIARIAGQFAKPRSSPTETTPAGDTIMAYRGDNVNGFEATPESRRPDPDRLVQAYFHSAATLNYLRASLASGLADLHAPLDWDLGHGALDPRTRAEYDEIVTRITDALTFMNSVGAAQSRELETADIYTSHEGLMLEYEEALTREVTQRPPRAQSRSPATASTRAPRPRNAVPAGFYATSGHFLWIGDRTRQVKGAHVEFFRGLQNPVGIKIGPSMEPVKLVELLDIVNPNREVGKVTLITRYGAANVEKFLPVHIRAVLATDHKVVWQCDPMHGNTRTTEQGVKTRSFDDVAKEVKLALIIHRQLGTYLGGLHLELTGEAVTECTGGAGGLTDDRLAENYRSFCDPRLNEKQALELAFVVARFHREEQARRDADEAGTEVLGVAA